MSNALNNYNETFFAQEALIQLEKVMGLANRVYRDYEPDPQTKGDTIQIRRPTYFAANDAPATATDLNPDKVSITLNKWKEVKFKLTDKELSLSSDKIVSDHIRPAAVALADQIDMDLASLYSQIPWYTQLTNPPVLDDIGAARAVLFKNKVPLEDGMLSLMMSGNLERYMLKALGASGNMPGQQDPAVRAANVGRIYGANAWANQNTPSFTSGVAAAFTGTATGVNAVGATTFSSSGYTAAGTTQVGDILTITGDPQQYAITNAQTAVAGAFTTMGITPALKKATVGGEVTTLFLGGAAKDQNLLFHRNAIALATAPLSDIGNQLGARIATIADPKTGLALRSRLYYVGDTSTVYVALDVLYGFAVLDPNLALRMYSA